MTIEGRGKYKDGVEKPSSRWLTSDPLFSPLAAKIQEFPRFLGQITPKVLTHGLAPGLSPLSMISPAVLEILVLYTIYKQPIFGKLEIFDFFPIKSLPKHLSRLKSAWKASNKQTGLIFQLIRLEEAPAHVVTRRITLPTGATTSLRLGTAEKGSVGGVGVKEAWVGVTPRAAPGRIDRQVAAPGRPTQREYLMLSRTHRLTIE
ncbi:hypothetical protein KQX54_019735 [Cotesia glomerata]|uniref:Uncharacterized protein n=1 Tax=Cotesia glomerata TaxID=32391 RepID=A0AAV7IYP7_COTGL|nr:hypothetical protein KQX54_019735 [Cotesia glomerata]